MSTSDDNLAEVLAAAPAGARIEGRMPVGTMASGAEIAIPFVALKGGRPGKRFWINGQVHGTEVTGIVAALDFINGLDASELTGDIIVTPTANPLGFDGRQINVPQDNNNLDQSYPGRPNGFTAERLAYTLLEAIKSVQPDLAISMHSQAVQTSTRSYAVYKQPPGTSVAEDMLFPFIAAFDPACACRMSTEPGSGEIPGNHAGALDYQLNALGIPTFMVELGSGQRADADEVARGVAGYRGVAQRLGIVPGTPPSDVKTLRRVTRRGHVTISHGGLFRMLRRPAELVKAGEPLGEIMNLHGNVVETLTLPQDVVIIGIRHDPVVHSGDRVAYVAQEWNEVTVRY